MKAEQFVSYKLIQLALQRSTKIYKNLLNILNNSTVLTKISVF